MCHGSEGMFKETWPKSSSPLVLERDSSKVILDKTSSMRPSNSSALSVLSNELLMPPAAAGNSFVPVGAGAHDGL